ncbi:MAG: 30S ribosomal protein S6 [Gammaproteobacteria bacterium]|nr:30S ribosomal protein S6 [Gammaproteobacteria bacterium]
MKKYEAVVILNPNLSTKVDEFIKKFSDLLSANNFSILRTEDIGRRQLSYSINNHNKGHYLIFDIEGDPLKLIEIENKIKYDETIIRHLFVSVRDHLGENSQLFIESKNKKDDVDDSKIDDNDTISKSKVTKKEAIEGVEDQEPDHDSMNEASKAAYDQIDESKEQDE